MESIKNIITGGCGFIGSHLTKRLLDKGEEVICLDNYFTGVKDNVEEHFKTQISNLLGMISLNQ